MEAVMPMLTETTLEHLQRMECNARNACTDFTGSYYAAKQYLALCERLDSIREFIRMETERTK